MFNNVATLTPPALPDHWLREEPVDQQIDLLQREIELLRQELAIQQQQTRAHADYLHRIDEELRLAARLQRDFLPSQLPQLGGVHFHVLFRPAGHVSGDLYDVMRLDETHVGFYVADAVGHGMPAALLTMFLKRALHTKEIRGGNYRIVPPAETMARLNDSLIEQNLSHVSFATALYGLIDTATGHVRFARGGHPNPILLPRTGSIRDIPSDGSLLGVVPNETYQEASLQLDPGDRLVIYTDGVEAVCGDDDAAHDAQRWRDELHRRRRQHPAQFLDDLARRIDDCPDPMRRRDDLTLLVIENRAQAA